MAGLFGVTGSSARIENLGVLDADISVDSYDERSYAGALAGENAGTISNSYSAGSNVTSATYTIAKPAYGGGLVGSNSGTITSSYSTAAVVVGAWGYANSVYDSSYAGGLAGENSGTITNSYAGGAVSSESSSDGGGLAGANTGSGTITNSYVRGLIDSLLFGANPGGGIAASNSGTITDSYYDTENAGAVTAACLSGDCSGAVGLSMNQMGNTSGTYPVNLGSGFELTQNYYSKVKRCINCTGSLSFSSDLVAGQNDVSTLYTESWNAGGWGSCSGACGGGSGTETRTVTCQGGNGQCDPAIELNSSQICTNNSPCCTPWDTTNWTASSSCTQTCGGGTQTEARSVTCPSGDCCTTVPPSSQEVSCNTQTCQWDVGDWVTGSCNGTCGGYTGTQTDTRSVSLSLPWGLSTAGAG